MLLKDGDLKLVAGKTADPAVSIIIPTHRVSSERQQDYIRLKNAIKKVQEQLESEYPKKEVQPVIDRLWAILEEIDYSRLLEGLGVFLSHDFEKIVDLPFNVEERVVVDNSFEVRDIVLAQQRLVDYFLLSLHEDEAVLFYGKGANIKRVEDDKFPVSYDTNAWDKEKANFINPATGSSQGTLEKENTEQRSLQYFLRRVDQYLTDYLTNPDTPLFLIGGEQVTGEFQQITQHQDHITATVGGNYKHFAQHELADKLQPEINKYLQELRQAALDRLENISRDYVTAGLPQVYRAANDGRADTLLVEKGYKEAAYLDKEYQLLYTNPEQTEGLTYLKDAVDDTIEQVSENNGQIRFVEDGKLAKYERIALILRY